MYSAIHPSSATATVAGNLPGSEVAVEIRIASTEAEYETAFRIAYEVYRPLGYVEYSPAGLRVAPAQLKLGTVVLMACHQGQAIATLSVYEDGPEGIPSESIWPMEVENLRNQGRRFFELGSLMVLPGYIHLGTRLCMELFRAAYLYIGGVKKADTICAFVTPKHAWFYEKMVGFREFGPLQKYYWNGLRFAEVVPLFMNLLTAEEDFHRRFEHWGDSPRNLYRFFVKDAAVCLDLLRTELNRREGLDFIALMERFERYLPAKLQVKVLES